MTGQKYGVYSEFTPSEGGWLGDIPTHWSANKLKFLASTFASNVDKKTKDGELPVQLCNYTDVYYNDVVSFDLPFMKATATGEQIGKFTLRAGDTIITKDSEDPNDIAVPAFVEQDMPGVICGYHLSMIRPTPIMSPGFLNKTFQCAFARAYFATRSNGLTRYGLGGQALSSVVLPVPPLEEQTQIAKFLDYETAKIDALIEKQQQLIALLKEKRQAVISHAVTKGLNPDAPMGDSGVEWLGEVPAHWTTKRLKHVSPRVGVGLVINPSTYTKDEGVYFLFGGDVNEYSFDLTNTRRMSPEDSDRLAPSRLNAGDLVSVRVGDPGVTAVVPPELEGANCASVVIVRRGDFHSGWLCSAMNSWVGRQQVGLVAYGAAQKQFNISDAVEFRLPVPPREEQEAISAFIADSLTRFDKLSDRATEAVELLQERRAALISAAVTGKIDVRGWRVPESEAEAEVA